MSTLRKLKISILAILALLAIIGILGTWVLILRDTGKMPPRPDLKTDALLSGIEHSGRLSVEVVRNTHRIYSRHVPEGETDAWSIYPSGALGEQLTAMAIMKLSDSGLIDPDALIGRYLPELPPSFHAITIHALLSHTSGLDPALCAFDPQRPPVSSPGVEARYAAADYDLLQRLLQRVLDAVAPMPAHRFIEDQLLSALEMEHTFFVPDEDEETRGQWYSCAEDLLAWEAMPLSGKLVRLKAMQRFLTPVKLLDGQRSPFGYGWSVRNLRGLRMEQSLVSEGNATITRFSEKVFAVVILSDIPVEVLDTRRLAVEIAEIYLGREMMRGVSGASY